MTRMDAFRLRFTQVTTGVAAFWLFGFLLAGLVLNEGDLSQAAGGTLLVSFIPAALFLLTLAVTLKIRLIWAWRVALTFWIVVFTSLALISFSAWNLRTRMPEDRVLVQLTLILMIYLGQSIVAGICAMTVLVSARKERKNRHVRP